MRYLGGKNKIRKPISKFLESIREGKDYFEPFVGGAWVLQEMSGKRTASDGNKAVVTLYRSLQNGWIPPDTLDEATYNHYRLTRPDDDPMTAFCGAACSFAGKWFAGLARSHGKPDPAPSNKRSLLKQAPKIKDVTFVDGLFNDHHPENCLVYLDPPYVNTTAYGAFKGFNHDLFWSTVREWATRNIVVVSEYQAPSDFVCVQENISRMGMTLKSGERTQRIERLFMLKKQDPFLSAKTFMQMEFSF